MTSFQPTAQIVAIIWEKDLRYRYEINIRRKREPGAWDLPNTTDAGVLDTIVLDKDLFKIRVRACADDSANYMRQKGWKTEFVFLDKDAEGYEKHKGSFAGEIWTCSNW